ncbi:MAG: hypothetical protein NUV86_06420 [Candidatus Scalindua sp.]|nr:hypothetical protein [Candidatus Scalindua sp.]MCR4344806.1 hypothetical protein [Candidatus Scalindua sp.]
MKISIHQWRSIVLQSLVSITGHRNSDSGLVVKSALCNPWLRPNVIELRRSGNL